MTGVPAGAVRVPDDQDLPQSPVQPEALIEFMQRRDAALQANWPAVGECPDWCEVSEHVKWYTDGEDDYCYMREHERHFGERLCVARTEVRPFRASASTFTPPRVEIYTEEGEELTVERARELSGDLAGAVAFIEEITG